MIPTVKAACPACGEAEMLSAQVQLVVCDCERQSRSFYMFTCPSCARGVVHKLADRVDASLLIDAGVPVARCHGPAQAPPISYDDVLDFHLALQGDGAPAMAR